jgi:hypothetical protein
MTSDMVVFSRHMTDNSLALTNFVTSESCHFEKMIVLNFQINLLTFENSFKKVSEANGIMAEFHLFFDEQTNFDIAADATIQALLQHYTPQQVVELAMKAKASPDFFKRIKTLRVCYDLTMSGRHEIVFTNPDAASQTMGSQASSSQTSTSMASVTQALQSTDLAGPSTLTMPGTASLSILMSSSTPASTSEVLEPVASSTGMDFTMVEPAAASPTSMTVPDSPEDLRRISTGTLRDDTFDEPSIEEIKAYRFMARSPVTFGNCKGLTHEQVFKDNRSYVHWAIGTHLANDKAKKPSGELGRFVDFCYFAARHPYIFDP